MRILTYQDNDTLKLGIKTDDGVIAVEGLTSAPDIPTTPDAFYRMGLEAVDKLASLVADNIDPQHLLDESALTLGACVPNPGKILCVGLNYRKHAAESGMDAPSSPVMFSKFNNTIAADGEVIPNSTEYTQIDYEAELVVVIGKQAKAVSESEALDYVLGYCNANDLSERNLQIGQPGGQWLLGKTPDKFLPIGPYMVTADEVGDPQAMSIKGWLNGEERQNSNTSDMIFTIAQVIAFVSRFMTLNPGDIISTGTPEGVILGMEDKVWMQAGDEYVIEIGNLGRLSNTIGEA